MENLKTEAKTAAKKYVVEMESKLKNVAQDAYKDILPELITISERIVKLQAKQLLNPDYDISKDKGYKYLFEIAIPSLEYIVKSKARLATNEAWKYTLSVVEGIAKQAIEYTAFAARAGVKGFFGV